MTLLDIACTIGAQSQVSSATTRARALAAIRHVPRSVPLDFIALAIQGKKIGFGKVIGMIDEMVVYIPIVLQEMPELYRDS